MSQGYAYSATTEHYGLQHIIVNCDADKLIITKMDNIYLSTLPGAVNPPQFYINWSNVSKISVDHLVGDYSAGGVTTRQYHFEFVNMAQLSGTFLLLLGHPRKFSFSITDQRLGTSLLFETIELGCLDKMNQSGDFLWEILENPAKANAGRPCAIGWDREAVRLQQSLQQYIDCSVRFSAVKK